MKIFLDFDDTMVESSKRIVELINRKYSCNKDICELKDYRFQSIYPVSKKEVTDFFASDDFFNNLEKKIGIDWFINKNFSGYKIIISTKGTPKNLIKKEKWLMNNYLHKVSFIGLTGDPRDKSAVDMKDSIQIDDNVECLNTNAKIKILYKSSHNYEWQKLDANSDIIVANTWKEVDDIIGFYSMYNFDNLEPKEKK